MDSIRIKNALDSVRAKPAPCPRLAQIGDSLLAHGTLHVFAYDTSYHFRGAVGKIGGGWSGGNSWMVLADTHTKTYYDRAHHGSWPAPQNATLQTTLNVWLQVVLAHEFDHADDQYHITNDNRLTRNTYACGGLP